MSISSIGGLGHDPGVSHADDIRSVQEACEYLRCSRTSLYRMLALGQLRRVKVLNRTLIAGARAHVSRQLSAEG